MQTRRGIKGMAVMLTAGLAMGFSGTAFAQVDADPAPPAPYRVSTGNPARDSLIRLSQRMTMDLEDERVEDVLRFIQESTGTKFEIMWIDQRHAEGLDPEQTITVSVTNVTALTLLERVLDEVQSDFDGNTWQFNKYGAMQVGPKSRLGRYRRIQLYDIYDLIMDQPDYEYVPEIDLQQAMQQSSGRGGGGSSQSPFNQDQDDDDEDKRTLEERADEILDIITELVEFEQWIDNGGENASIRQWNGTLIVNAPDFVHRQINGYSWFPSGLQSSRVVEGRRYVSFDLDTGISKIDGFAQSPVTAVVNGQIVRSNDPGGG
ncbi:MAG: hypothetical protein IID31_07085 [Planctomycetes bacterium]|nr:hypothetical protein [Planctomycetota bacterium]